MTTDAAAVPTGAPAAERDPRRWIVLGVMCLSLLLIVMDNTIVNVALPTLQRDLEASTSQLQRDDLTPEFQTRIARNPEFSSHAAAERYLEQLALDERAVVATETVELPSTTDAVSSTTARPSTTSARAPTSTTAP